MTFECTTSIQLRGTRDLNIMFDPLGSLTNDERSLIQRALDRMAQERDGTAGVAILTHPINIGIGIK